MKTKISDRISEAIADYLEDNICEEDEIMLSNWVQESRQHVELFRQMAETWRLSLLLRADREFDSGKAWDDMTERLRRPDHEETPLPPKKYGKALWFAVAASVALLIVCSTLAWALRTERHSDQMFVHLTEKGTHSDVFLGDGTLVSLNNGTQMSYSRQYGRKLRAVTLNGEAYFDVAKDKKVPFEVNLSDCFSLQVLGTRFNVKSYDNEDRIMVTLDTGSIRATAGHSNHSIVLVAGEQLIYNKQTRQMIKRQVDTRLYSNWRDDMLVFDDEDLLSIFRSLERQFDVNVQVRNPSILGERYTGQFNARENIERIFGIMSSDGRFKYRFRGDTVEIH